MSHINYDLCCCGINELADIYDDGTAEESVLRVDNDVANILLFSDINRNNYRYGRKLAALIEKEKLGVVVALPVTYNPNSGNRVKAWLWSVRKRKVQQFQKALYKSGKFEQPYDPWNY